MPEPLFEEIDHTADLTIVVRGSDQGDLFARAGRALYALMVDAEGVEVREWRQVAAKGEDPAELLQDWLSQLLLIFACDGFIARVINVLQICPTEVRGELGGETFEPGRHVYVREVKAVTYHGLRVDPEPDGWQARVTFDV